MTGDKEGLSDAWKNFLRKHWKMTLVFIAVVTGAVIGSLLVFLWVVGDMQANDLVPTLIGEWTIGYVITFMLNVILWEVLFILIPVAVVAILIFGLWWRKLPAEEREEYQTRPKKWPRRGTSRGSGDSGFSLIVTIAWLIIVWRDGRWDVPFQSWTLENWVYSWLAAFLWVSLIIGIPVLIGATWWLRRELKEEPPSPPS